jgi:hypothetical protein
MGIHASKTLSHVEQDLCHQEPFKSVLKAHGIEYVNQLPAVAILTDCHLVDELTDKLTDNERGFGDHYHSPRRRPPDMPSKISDKSPPTLAFVRPLAKMPSVG